MARQNLVSVDTPNKQIILITDGLPCNVSLKIHFCTLGPPTRSEKHNCEKEPGRGEGIVINMFLVPSWCKRKRTFGSSPVEQRGESFYSRPTTDLWYGIILTEKGKSWADNTIRT